MPNEHMGFLHSVEVPPLNLVVEATRRIQCYSSSLTNRPQSDANVKIRFICGVFRSHTFTVLSFEAGRGTSFSVANARIQLVCESRALCLRD